jgi:hypothetical protein
MEAHIFVEKTMMTASNDQLPFNPLSVPQVNGSIIFPSGDFAISNQLSNKKMRRLPPTELIESNFISITREKQVHTDLVAITKPDDAREILCVAPKSEMSENLLLDKTARRKKDEIELSRY